MRLSTRTTRLDDLVAIAARDHPDQSAISDGERTLSYADLEERVHDLAGALSTAGVRPGDRVGVYLSKGVDAVSVIHAVLRCRAVAAPLDVSDPPERTARMARNAGLAFLVTSPQKAAPAALVKQRIDQRPVPVEQLRPGVSILPLAPAAGSARPPQPDSDGGYLLFTSGSTGWPKGVLLSHENVLHFVRWAVEEFGVKFSDRIGSQSSLTFDLSTFDIFGSAMSGACLCLLPDALKGFPSDAVRWLRDERISIFYAVPTLYQALLHRGGIGTIPLPGLRIIAFAGEPFPVGDLQAYAQVFRATAFYNLYGPTETNVCTFERLPPGWRAQDGLSIGRALPGLQVVLVNEEHRVMPDQGEIAVAGPGVFLGYLQDGELRTHTSPVRFADGSTAPAYLTGDLGHYGEDGKIYVRGRRDHQVKRRGYRIDLQDIESVVQEFESVRSCAAVWKPGQAGAGRIELYVVAEGVTREELRRSISSALPRHMAPDEVHLVDRMRLTERGKIDREALTSMDPTQEESDHGQRR